MPLPFHEAPSASPSPTSKRFKPSQLHPQFQNNNADTIDADTNMSTSPLTHISGLQALDHELHGARTFDDNAPDAHPRYRNQPETEQLATQAAELSMAVPLQVKKLSAGARAPTRGSAYAAGYDLYASEDGVVPGRGKTMIATGIAIAVPPGTYGRVAPRSGLAAKHGIATGAGVIDYDYRGEVKVILFNHLDSDFAISTGDRIAQLVLERIVTPDVVEVMELEGTERGTGGFGSTGGFAGQADIGVDAPMEGVSNGLEGGMNVLTGGAGMTGI